MREADDEMSHSDEYSHVVVNDDLNGALNDLKSIVSGHMDAVRKVTIEA